MFFGKFIIDDPGFAFAEGVCDFLGEEWKWCYRSCSGSRRRLSCFSSIFLNLLGIGGEEGASEEGEEGDE